MRRPRRPGMWQASRLKKAAKKSHSGNFGASHIVPDEHFLGRTGLRGRKVWVALTVLALVYLVVTANLVLTCFILGVLRFDATGPPYFIFGSGGSLIWPQGATITDVRVLDQIRAYQNQSLTVSGAQSPITLQAGNPSNDPSGPPVNSSRLSVSQAGVRLHPSTSLAYCSRDAGGSRRQHLAINASHAWLERLPADLQLLQATRVVTNEVRSSQVVSTGGLAVSGAGGLSLEGKRVELTAASNITISTAINEGMTMLSASSMFQVVGLSHIVNDQSTGALGDDNLKFHVCVCPSGLLFRVPANTRRCAAANELVNPCS